MSSVVIAGNTSGSVTLSAPDIAGTTTLTLPNASGTVVTSANINTYASSFPAGTRLSFQQTAAPTGWTKDTTAAINDSVLRFVTGTASSGGSLAFSTWAAQTSDGATTLAESQIPSHSHAPGSGAKFIAAPNGSLLSSTGGSFGSISTPVYPTTTANTGGGGSHTHSLSQSLKYYDFIIASKD